MTEMPDVAASGRSAHQRLVRERFIWWFRVAAAGFIAVQNTIEPGDDTALSWVILAFFVASIGATGLALAGSPDERSTARLGALTMAADVAVTAAIMANNLTDPAEPIYLIVVLTMLEATMRWRRWGGIVGGVAAGVAAGVWTVVVSQRALGQPQIDYASMRAGVIVGLGVFLGFLVRRLTEQHDTLQGILDTTQDLIVTLDVSGTITSINASSELLLGYRPEHMIGQRYWDFFHPDDVQVRADRRLAIPSEEPVLFERRVRGRDGSYRWLELNAVAVPGSDTVHVSGRDVTERREAHRRIEESEQRFRSLFEHNTDGVFALDPEGRFTMVNPGVERIIGFSAEDLVGSSFVPLVDPDWIAIGTERFRRAFAGEAQDYEIVVRGEDGRRIELDITNVPIVVDGAIVGVFGLAKDVTDRRQLERDLGHQATHDTLTGLANRAQLEDALEVAAASGGRRTLLFIDLDRFKLVNDSLGHRSGDQLLVAAVARMQRHVRAGDLLARWAGDEFCVLLAPGTGDELALKVAERLRAVLAEPFGIAGRDVRLSASIGIASAGDGETERLVQVADLAMYQAKRAGRDRVAVYSPEHTPPALNQLDLEGELATALERGDLVAHYQPIVETSNGRVRAVEALVRWPQPDGSVRLPTEFVPVAEESGLIRLLTRHVIADACRQLVRWDAMSATAGLQAWVNTSIADLESARFAAEVGGILDEADVEPSRLVLEVTETMLMRDAAQVVRTIAELVELGVSLAIDDFGTGYSSLNQLHQLQVAACKVDREFVSQAPERVADAVILRALVEVGTAFGLPVVAEGIERPEELAAATAAGAPLAQGFLLGVPCPPEHLDDLLRRGTVPLDPLRPGSESSPVPSAR
jgi:diguanylate cyclase (GGDEF)-like protein/PAS domain S-box-containing protein